MLPIPLLHNDFAKTVYFYAVINKIFKKLSQRYNFIFMDTIFTKQTTRNLTDLSLSIHNITSSLRYFYY